MLFSEVQEDNRKRQKMISSDINDLAETSHFSVFMRLWGAGGKSLKFPKFPFSTEAFNLSFHEDFMRLFEASGPGRFSWRSVPPSG
jgi:hypothetical protein